MWICLGFHQGDLRLAKDLLQWCKQLEPRIAHGCLLVADAGIDWADAQELVRLASNAFQRVELSAIDVSVKSWPAGANYLFRQAAQFFEKRSIGPWFWCEPDCIPIKVGWADKLESEYSRAGKQFLGCLTPSKGVIETEHYLPGCAIYPMNAWSIMNKAWDECRAFDVATSKVTVPIASHTNLIQHFWGRGHMPPTFTEIKTPESPVNSFTMSMLHPEAVVFHSNKDSTLINLLRYRNSAEDDRYDVFAHGGDVGDMIYGMAAMKALGPKPLILHKHGVREQWSENKVRAIAPLLEMQPYIKWVRYEENIPNTKWNFNPFRERNWGVRGTPHRESLCDTQLRLFNLPVETRNNPWLDVDDPIVISGKPVVIHRSPRYHNPEFPWREIRRLYGASAVFVGMKEEWLAWQKLFGSIEYYPTTDYLELARVIAGSTLFIGNQSCPYAIAEAMKQNAILESFQWALDCQFDRVNLINDYRGAKIRLPSISELWEKRTNIVKV